MVAPGPTRHLHQRGKEPLGRAKVGSKQGRIGVDHHHQRELPEVVTLGEHLGTHQQIDLTGMRGIEHLLRRAATAGDIAIEPADACARKQRLQALFESLGATTEASQIDIAAFGARPWYRLICAAVMTH